MTFASAQALVADDLIAVEELILKKAGSSYAPLTEALGGLVRSGGKRVRPTVVLLTGHLFPPAKRHALLALAAAVEALHTATLIHDDVIDGAFVRRGQSTLNAMWTPSSTVMAGDFFFARAAALAAETEHPRVIQLFAETLNTIVDGELRQAFAGHDWDQPKESYFQRIYGKTAALFEVSARATAVLGNAPAGAEQAMRAYGYDLGMAFQIVDDILDFTADAAALGKPAGSDLRSGIITLPVFYFIQKPEQRQRLVAAMEGKEGGTGMDRAVEMVRQSEGIDLARAEAVRFAESAVNRLTNFASAPHQRALADIARYVVERRQ